MVEMQVRRGMNEFARGTKEMGVVGITWTSREQSALLAGQELILNNQICTPKKVPYIVGGKGPG